MVSLNKDIGFPGGQGTVSALPCVGQPCEGAGETHVLQLNEEVKADVSQTHTLQWELQVPYTEDNGVLGFPPPTLWAYRWFFGKVLRFTLACIHIFPAHPQINVEMGSC